MKYTSIIYLTKKYVTSEEWQEFINTVSNYNGHLKKWKIAILFDENRVNYLLETDCPLPSSINGLESFILKTESMTIQEKRSIKFPIFMKIGCNAVDIKNYLSFRKNESLKRIEITFKKVNSRIVHSTDLITINEKKYHLLFDVPSNILSINFESNYGLSYKSAPKYLDINKGLHLLKSEPSNSILKVDTFPYLQGDYFLNQSNVSFDKHSIVFGSSGSGKSKFISLLVDNIYKNEAFRLNNKIVVIDPHASLESDIGGLGRVIDFMSSMDSIDLFSNDTEENVISVELLLDVFKGLIPNGYNSKLERVLRHSIYLLLSSKAFNIKNLRKVILDMNYRNDLINSIREEIPFSIVEFFLSEFNEIKTKSYTESISPIIALIDEMEMIPVFNEDISGDTLKNTIDNNFLTLFSLDRTKLGDNVTKTISGLIMEQLLTLVQKRVFSEHIIFIVDEVALIENPILNRFLSESRKYNLSLILAGQYFGGISEQLKEAIFANVINYYIFRVSTNDANMLVDNLDMKIPLDNTREKKVQFITGLQDRECIIRISSNGCLIPPMKCSTLNFNSTPRVKKDFNNSSDKSNLKNNKMKKKIFKMSNVDLKGVLSNISTSRKENNL